MWISLDIRGESSLSRLSFCHAFSCPSPNHSRFGLFRPLPPSAALFRDSILRPLPHSTKLVDRRRPRLRLTCTLVSPTPTRKNTRASAGRHSIGLKIFFEDFLKVPFGNSSSRIEPRSFYLGGESSGFALDDLESQSIQHLPDRPGPSLHNTAAATSLTSFINVPSQPISRKSERGYFLGI
jgi:hypothetical protein